MSHAQGHIVLELQWEKIRISIFSLQTEKLKLREVKWPAPGKTVPSVQDGRGSQTCVTSVTEGLKEKVCRNQRVPVDGAKDLFP